MNWRDIEREIVDYVRRADLAELSDNYGDQWACGEVNLTLLAKHLEDVMTNAKKAHA